MKGITLPLLLAVLSLFTVATSQANRNQGIRLANSTLGSHAGRVEVMYHGRWGTVCDIGWSSYDAAVACRMLNFTSGYICAVTGAPAPFGQGTGTVWLSNLRCNLFDTHLDQCRNNNPYNLNPCLHSRDAALICQDPSVMPIPENITMFNHTTRSILVQWNLDFIPPLVRAIDFRLNYSEVGSSIYRTSIVRKVVTPNSRDFNYTITGLLRNISYSLSIRAEGEYQWCPYTELIGVYSDPVIVFTNATIPPSTLPMRLVSSGTRSYIGRFQVQYQGVWGNVCDDLFDMVDANLACQGLNYTEGAICYANRPFPLTTAPILLDDLNCRNAERFEDCTHRGWRSHNCVSSEAIGLICNPGNLDVPVVTGLRATNVSPTRITVEWDAVSDITQYRLYLNAPGQILRSYFRAATLSTQYTFSVLVLGANYTINISAAVNFRQYTGGNCYSRNFYGDSSDPISVVTRESPPTVRIKDFHVSLLNTTSVEVTWNPPSSTVGINGVIRGYKLFVQRENMTTERIIDINGTTTRVYILNDLVENVTYSFSILMYTVGDGPRSVRLRVTVPNLSNLPLIWTFGMWGDNIEVRRGYTSNRGFNVLCGSNFPDVTYEWRFANGSSIGIVNQRFRAAHFDNDTAVLQIGTASLYPRRLTICDGGIYTCVATNAAGRTEERNFTLTIGFSQPTLLPPTMITRGSTWIQIGWESLDCDGGYPLEGYVVQYRLIRRFGSYITATEVTSLNYTIRNLNPDTSYYFRIGRRSTRSFSLQYSGVRTMRTFTSGPSPPRGVSVRLGFNSEVCATWRLPSLPVGTIILYKLYAEPVANSQDTYDSVDLPNSTFVQSFPGSQTSGCMKLSLTGIIYHFQMSAVAVIRFDHVEGTLSPYSATTTLYVPESGVVQPINVAGNSTNTTVTFWWQLPANNRLEDSEFFNVSYSGVVEWTSPTGAYSRLLEQGWMRTRATSLTFSYLTPSTNYDFSVAVVTDIETGPRATTTIRTVTETGEKLAFFQVRILKIGDCNKWVGTELADKLSDIRNSFMTTLLSVCLSQPRISQGEFSCRTGPSDSVVYRARVSGTPSRSASDTRDCIREWVMADKGSVTVGNSRYHLDASCDSFLDSIHAPDCPVPVMSTSSTTQITSSTTKKASSTTKQVTSTTPPTTPKPSSDAKPDSVKDVSGEERGAASTGASTGQVAGILLGAVIVGLLITLVIILAFILYQRRKAQVFMKSQSNFNELVNEPTTPTTTTRDETL